MKTEYREPISTLAEVRHLWRYLGAASQCNLLLEFGVSPHVGPLKTDDMRLSQLVRLWDAGSESERRRICEFVEEVADTARGQG